MKYQELLDRFWGMDSNFSAVESLLYLYLLHRCNSLGWPDTFSLSNVELIERLKCRAFTFRAARKALVDSSLICYNVGNGRGSVSTYAIVIPDEIEKGVNRDHLFEEKRGQSGPPLSEKGVNRDYLSCEKGSIGTTFMPKSDNKGVNRDHLSDESTISKETTKEKKALPPAPPTIEKKDKKKRSTADTCVREDGQTTLFKEKPLKKKRQIIEPHLPKDIDEVLAFFEENAADLPDWENEAETFYLHFKSVGWMGTSNRQIKDWESRARLWISDKIVKNKNEHATTTTYNPSDERAASDREAAEVVARLLRANQQRGD